MTEMNEATKFQLQFRAEQTGYHTAVVILEGRPPLIIGGIITATFETNLQLRTAFIDLMKKVATDVITNVCGAAPSSWEHQTAEPKAGEEIKH